MHYEWFLSKLMCLVYNPEAIFCVVVMEKYKIKAFLGTNCIEKVVNLYLSSRFVFFHFLLHGFRIDKWASFMAFCKQGHLYSGVPWVVNSLLVQIMVDDDVISLLGMAA